MPTFAFVTVGVAAHVNRRAVFLSQDPRIGAGLEERGFEFVLLEAPRRSVRRSPSPRRLSRARAEVRQAYAVVTGSRETLERLEALRPDHVLVDYELADRVSRVAPTRHRLPQRVAAAGAGGEMPPWRVG